MPRSTAVSSYDNEVSSPDPLATSSSGENTTGHVAVTNRSQSPKKQTAPVNKSPKRASKSISHDSAAISSSPFRAVSEQNLSPWKIRVTVEAEPDDSETGDASQTTMTRTMKIPLRPDSPRENNAKTSTRGRKSQSAVTKNKRSATPVRGGTNRSRRRRPSVTDLDIRPLGDDEEEDDWLKSQVSPRKRRASRSRKSTPVPETGSQVSSSSGRSTRKKSTVSEFEIRQDTDAEGDVGILRRHDAISEAESPGLRKIDMNRVSVRPRTLPTKLRADEELEHMDSNDHNNSEIASTYKPAEVRRVSVNSAMSYPTPSPTSSYHRDSDDIGKVPDAEPVRVDENEGVDSVSESEGFTMIDLDTLPSARRYLSTSETEAGNHYPNSAEEASSTSQGSSAALQGKAEISPEALQPSTDKHTVACPALNLDESEISSTVPSSPPLVEREKGLLQVPSSSSAGLARKVTPQPYSSPKLPSPPKQIVRKTPRHQHRGSASAIFAGIALQEVVSPEHVSDKPSSTEGSASAPSQDLDDDDVVFKGFDSGTKRELRAGLRFGEELAKRQSPSPPMEAAPPSTSSQTQSRSDLTTGYPTSTQVWRGETTVQRTPLQSSANSRSKVVELGRPIIETPQIPSPKKRDETILDTQARREREWQLEREAVSRQIQNASESQVIVIDSDDGDDVPANGSEDMAAAETQTAVPDEQVEGEEEEDVWLAEAKNSSSSDPSLLHASQPTGNDLFTRTEQLEQRERAKEVVSKPRGCLIPSPWKRGDDISPPQEQNTLLSTYTDDMSGLIYWKEPESQIKFGAGEIKRQQWRHRSGSGRFDIDLMAGTPRKEAVEDEPVSLEGSSFAEEDNERPRHSYNSTATDGVRETLPTKQAEDGTLDETNDNLEGATSPEAPVKVSVNFNDSSISIGTSPAQIGHSQLQPPFADTTSISSPQRPPTPRSAMKGSRQIFEQTLGTQRTDTPIMIRKVVFSERSRGVDIHGLEGSFSIRTSSDDSMGGEAGMQLNRELLSHEQEQEDLHDVEVQRELEAEDEEPQAQAEVAMSTAEEMQTRPATACRDWKNWFWGSNRTTKPTSSTPEQSDTEQKTQKQKLFSKSTRPSNLVSLENKSQPLESAWEKAKATVPSSVSSHKPRGKSAFNRIKLPSYLLPPSCPSDPLRPSTSPLALDGNFTNTHFRTLNIIYRKSLRPKFHAPARDTIRDEILALRGVEMEIDESENGIDRGVFTWKVSDGECEVLERFMQEVELSHGWWKGKWVGIGVGGQGDDEGEDEEDRKGIHWGWSVEQLAMWLCRIVVGEAVREEERKSQSRSSKLLVADTTLKTFTENRKEGHGQVGG
ncbi:uncharacterized protein Z518_09168 [Rhinocladiella mackenziei CBS 650.93]|uniref:Uncharacterized protein n=1 Tax=Rhinocladiella mackenziei CBS 650.93 TaxID=1442369 RepID=A0A0D2FHH9_9EURO|nr:uncharacterized protein Z518_09168 [Rhinocladiella mackenziei CBS 650.93]KIX01442.1 hypothetical protein Z518_09168 [Rhinocladiella mackenziei CBS 650.93]